MPPAPADRVVFETGSVRIGAFRCPVDHPDFVDSGPIRNHCFVFPRTSVVIQHKDEPPFPADPTIVTLYNQGQEYRRQPISPDGDRCDWYAVSEEIVRDALDEYDPRAAHDESRPIRFARSRVDADTYLRQRQLFAAAAGDDPPDGLLVEETVLNLLNRVLEHAYAGSASRMPSRRMRRAADDLAEAACLMLGGRYADALSLGDIAGELDTSIYHLCRSFRRATGTTLHEYRNQLRLRSALDRLEADTDLSQLALDLGYSSHSHFTAAFRQAFGVTPSAVRRRLRASS